MFNAVQFFFRYLSSVQYYADHVKSWASLPSWKIYDFNTYCTSIFIPYGLIWKILTLYVLEQEIRALLTINADYEQTFEDVNSATSKAFVEDFVAEVHLTTVLQCMQNLRNF